MTQYTSPLDTRRGARRVVAAVGVTAALCGLVAGSVWRTPEVHAASPAAAAAPAAAPAPAVAGVSSYAAVVDQVTPSVVTVRVEKRAEASPALLPFDDQDFREFFGRNFQRSPQSPRAPRRMPRQQGLGSGVIVSPDGYILTNHHVVDGADRVQVELSDKRVLTATLVGDDPPSDLAVLKVEAAGLRPIPMADSDAARVGDVVLAIGNPLGVGQTVTSGIISAKGRTTERGEDSFQDFLQTDAPINHGNSGGALVNAQGELLGINSQMLSPSGGSIGLGFAIPSNMARNVMGQLISNGHVRRSKLGVTAQPVTSDIAASLGLTDVRGALISSVQMGSPAERAGLRQGDVITEVQGRRVTDGNDLRNAISSTQPGTNVALKVARDGRTIDVSARLDELKLEGEDARSTGDAPAARGQYGMSVTPLTPELAEQRSLPRSAKGIVVTDIDPDGQAAASGIEPNDVIEKVNGRATSSIAELKTAIEQTSGKPALVLVNRNGTNLFLTLRPARSS